MGGGKWEEEGGRNTISRISEIVRVDIQLNKGKEQGPTLPYAGP